MPGIWIVDITSASKVVPDPKEGRPLYPFPVPCRAVDVGFI
jgi:hypothetical protein